MTSVRPTFRELNGELNGENAFSPERGGRGKLRPFCVGSSRTPHRVARAKQNPPPKICCHEVNAGGNDAACLKRAEEGRLAHQFEK